MPSSVVARNLGEQLKEKEDTEELCHLSSHPAILSCLCGECGPYLQRPARSWEAALGFSMPGGQDGPGEAGGSPGTPHLLPQTHHTPMGLGVPPLGTASFLLPVTRIWKELAVRPRKVTT